MPSPHDHCEFGLAVLDGVAFGRRAACADDGPAAMPARRCRRRRWSALGRARRLRDGLRRPGFGGERHGRSRFSPRKERSRRRSRCRALERALAMADRDVRRPNARSKRADAILGARTRDRDLQPRFWAPEGAITFCGRVLARPEGFCAGESSSGAPERDPRMRNAFWQARTRSADAKRGADDDFDDHGTPAARGVLVWGPRRLGGSLAQRARG